MKRYLIRADFNPAIKVNPDYYVARKFVGGNSGNMVYAYGVMNVLKTDHVELDYTYKWKFSDSEVDYINNRYDAFIIPLADAFRSGFMKQLIGYTELLKQLKISVVIIGIGLRADYEPDIKRGFEFDDVAKGFVKEVLNKSAKLGLRGEITAEYLEYLGFVPERDFTPIGCPSLYTYGNSIKTKQLTLPVKKLAINTNGYYDIGHINELFLNTVKVLPDYHLIQQVQDEFQHMYVGNGWIPFLLSGQAKKQDKFIIKGNALTELYKQDRVRFFFDEPSWINFIKTFDLFVGSRFHGTVMAVLAGIPYVMIPFNARTRELTEYHKLTSLKPDEIRENTTILDYLGELDFHSFERHQERNLKHYIEFLEANGLEHIFKKKTAYKMGETLLESEIQETIKVPIESYCYVVHDYLSLSLKDKMHRAAACNWQDLKNRIKMQTSSTFLHR